MNESESAIDARVDSLVEDHERLLRALVAQRKEYRLSQEVVAERMNVTQPTVAAFERYDANPTLSTVRRYANAVGARLVTQIVDDYAQNAEPERTVAVEPVGRESLVKFLTFVTSDRRSEIVWDGPSVKLSQMMQHGLGALK